MKKIPYYFGGWLLVLATSAWSLNKPEADAFLWKAEKTGRPTVYLLGTIHIGKKGSTLSPAYQKVLQQSQQLIVESDGDELSQPEYAAEAAQLHNMMTSTRPLHQSLGKMRLFTLNQVLSRGQEPLKFNAHAYQTPWTVWLTVQTLYTPKGYSYRYGIDNLLLQQAKKQGKTIIALERLQPFYLMQNIPEDKILRSLDRVIFQHQAILAEQKKLVSLYQTNQAQALWQEVSEPKKLLRFTPQQDKTYWQDFMLNKLLIQRNQTWMVQLVSILPKDTTLIAVGAAHLFGEQGLIHKMRQLGYKVVPMYY